MYAFHTLRRVVEVGVRQSRRRACGPSDVRGGPRVGVGPSFLPVGGGGSLKRRSVSSTTAGRRHRRRRTDALGKVTLSVASTTDSAVAAAARMFRASRRATRNEISLYDSRSRVCTRSALHNYHIPPVRQRRNDTLYDIVTDISPIFSSWTLFTVLDVVTCDYAKLLT